MGVKDSMTNRSYSRRETMDEQHNSFEQLKQVDEGGMEYWSARSLAKLLDYSEYRHTDTCERSL